jgi:peptidoglycan-associated lipoprotein
MRFSAVLVIVAAAVLLAGCPKKPTTTTDKAATTPVPAEQAPAAATTGTEAGGAGAAKPLPETAPQGAEAAALATTVLYFDYDSSEIRPEYTAVIAAHGKRLSSSPGMKIRLEGHTDERGSPEYNIALGERRAQAVRRALMLQGAADGQATTVSYGEERPAVEGSDESAWAKNRRVEIVVSK